MRSSQLHIAMIGQKGVPATIGGVERYVEELSTRLVQKGQSVTIYTRPHYTSKKRVQHRGARLVSIPSIATKHLDAISHTFLCTLHAMMSGADILHYHGVGPALLSWIPRLCTPWKRVVVTFQCLDRKHGKWGWFARQILTLGERAAVAFPHVTVTVTRTMTEYCERRYSVHPTYIPNGATALGIERSVTRIRPRFGLSHGSYILAVSRLIPHKRLDDLIRAFRSIRTTKKLVIVGEGYHTESYEADLRRLAEGDERIVFTGRQSGKTLRELYTHAYCFVQPSATEGLSLALLEAMSYGLCSIVSDIPENVEVVNKREQGGIVYPMGNVRVLRTSLVRMLRSPVMAERIGSIARTIVMNEYGWDRIADQMASLYHDVSEDRGKRVLDRMSMDA